MSIKSMKQFKKLAELVNSGKMKLETLRSMAKDTDFPRLPIEVKKK